MIEHLRTLGRAFVWVVLVATVALVLSIVVVPRALGWVPLTVMSASMEPTIPTGIQVVVEPVEGPSQTTELRPGDIITFMPEPEDLTLTTHRVVGRAISSDGSVELTTQGDATDTPGPGTQSATQIRGVVRYHVPYAGYVARALSSDQKSTGSVITSIGLFGYAGLQLLTAVRDHRRRSARAARPA